MLLRFQYTDSKGKTTDRAVFKESETDNSLFAQDLGELTEEEIAEYVDARENALMQYEKLLFEINEAFDLKHKYRNFLTKNIKLKD